MEIIKMEKYKTVDGKVFKDKIKAKKHEEKIYSEEYAKLPVLFYRYGVIDYDNGESFDKLYQSVDLTTWKHPMATMSPEQRENKLEEYSKLLNIAYWYLEMFYLTDITTSSLIPKEIQYYYANFIDSIEKVIEIKKKQ